MFPSSGALGLLSVPDPTKKMETWCPLIQNKLCPGFTMDGMCACEGGGWGSQPELWAHSIFRWSLGCDQGPRPHINSFFLLFTYQT